MSNFETLKTEIVAAIYPNGVEAIDGQTLQDVLLDMVDALGNDYALAGAATPTTIPPTPDSKTAYVATTSGTFTYFIGQGGTPVSVPASALSALLTYDPTAGYWVATPFGTLAAGSIGTNELADGAVTTPKLADSAVTGNKLSNGAVSNANKLASNVVTTAKIADFSVTINKLNSNSVSSEKMTPNAVTPRELAPASVSGDKIADGGIPAGKLDNNSVATGNIQDEAVTAAKIAPASIGMSHINSGALDNVPTSGSDKLVKSGGVSSALGAKQDTIADLDTIRAGAALGATAYQKPSGGIPESDLSASVQTSLGKADTALQDIPDGSVSIAKIAPAAIDATPTANSGNLVTSGGVQSADKDLDAKIDDIAGKYVVNSRYWDVQSGGTITFNPITLAQAGDELEFEIEVGSGISTVQAFCFTANANNIAIGAGYNLICAKNSSNAWLTGMNGGSGQIYVTAATNHKYKIIWDSAGVQVYHNGTLLHTANATTITIDAIGNLTRTPAYWYGKIKEFRYTHNGVTTDLHNFPNLTYNSLVTLVEDITAEKGYADELSDAVADVAFNSFGKITTFPTSPYPWARFTEINGKAYTGTGNFLRYLGIKDGSVTTHGVTMTIKDGFVTFSGTANATGMISYHTLQWYTSGDAAVAATTMPSSIPNLGAFSFFFYSTSSPKKGTCYFRSKSSSWLATLTESSPTFNVTQSDYSSIGAIVAYIINGTTYSGTFGLTFVPQSLGKSFSWSAVPQITEIKHRTIYPLGEYTLIDGTATAYGLQPCTNDVFTEGKKVAWFGDSLSELGQLPHLVGKKMAVEVYDCSFAGSPLTSSGLSKYYDTGVQSLFAQIVADDFSLATAAINQQYTDGDITEARKNAKLANLATLSSLDFNEITDVVVLAGTNDLTVAALTIADFKTKINTAYTTIMTAYPHLRFHAILPPYRTDAYDAHPNGLTLPDINGAVQDVTELFGIPTLDFLKNCGVNSVTHTTFLQDGLHPNSAGDELWAERLAKWLLSI